MPRADRYSMPYAGYPTTRDTQNSNLVIRNARDMSATLELYDGSKSIDLMRAPYHASGDLRFGLPPAHMTLAGAALRGVRYSPRTVEISLNIRAASMAELTNALREIESVCALAERRSSADSASGVELRLRLSGDAELSAYRALRAELQLPFDLMQEPTLSAAYAAPGVLLRLLLEPFGRRSPVSGAAVTVRNAQHGGAVNYIDMKDIGGTQGAMLGLKIAAARSVRWRGAKRLWLARRSGERRADQLMFQNGSAASVRLQNGVVVWEPNSDITPDDPVQYVTDTVSDTLASGNVAGRFGFRWFGSGSVRILPRAALRVGTQRFYLSTPPSGLFRLLVRWKYDANFNSRGAIEAAWSSGRISGSIGKTRFVSNVSGIRTRTPAYRMDDLGEIALPPTPPGFRRRGLNILLNNIYATERLGGHSVPFAEWRIDFIMLLPIDEGAAIVSGVRPDDRILLDTTGDVPGVYLLDAGDVVQGFADFAGAPFDIGPEDTRIYLLRDDEGDPDSVGFEMTTTYIPLVAGM